MKKMLSIIAVLTVIFGMGMMTSCNSKCGRGQDRGGGL